MGGKSAERTELVYAVGGATEDLVRLRELAQRPSVEGALEAVRELLGMEVAYTSRIEGSDQVLEEARGDAASFGLAPGQAMPFELTYCMRVLSGRLPNLIPDVRQEERAASMPVTEAADVGSFASVPLRFSDGRLYGTLCAASHHPSAKLGYRELQFLYVFARIIADVIERQSLTESARSGELRAAAATTLIAAVHARDAYTAEHSRQVVEHAVAVAGRLGVEGEELDEVEHVAMLHDIGKIAIPDTILRKPGPLSRDEWQVMRTHPERGEELIRRTPGLDHLAPAIRAEHERWDGLGYPDGLAGEEIPVASRITFVCDAYNAMTSDRPYRRALAPKEARAEVLAGADTQFWSDAVEALLERVGGDTR